MSVTTNLRGIAVRAAGQGTALQGKARRANRQAPDMQLPVIVVRASHRTNVCYLPIVSLTGTSYQRQL